MLRTVRRSVFTTVHRLFTAFHRPLSAFHRSFAAIHLLPLPFFDRRRCAVLGPVGLATFNGGVLPTRLDFCVGVGHQRGIVKARAREVPDLPPDRCSACRVHVNWTCRQCLSRTREDWFTCSADRAVLVPPFIAASAILLQLLSVLLQLFSCVAGSDRHLESIAIIGERK